MIDENQEAIATAIAARPAIAAAIAAGKARVVSSVKGEIGNEIVRALGKLNLLIVVEQMEGTFGYVKDVPVLRTSPVICIFENVTLNRSGTGSVSAGKAVEEIAFAMKPSSGLNAIPTKFTLQNSMTKLLQYLVACEGRLTLTEETGP